MARPLKILMTTDTVGGVWSYCMELARALGSDRVRITLAAIGAGASPCQRATAAALPHVTLIENDFALEWMDEPWADVDAAGEWLLDIARETEPDVIHLNGYAHAALPWNAPAIVVAHSCVLSWWKAVKSEHAPTRLNEYQRRAEAGLQAASLVIAPTSAMLTALDDHYSFSSEREVISNGVDGAKFRPLEKQRIVASAGRVWDEAKNIQLLSRIAPSLAWPVYVAGSSTPPDRSASGVTNHSTLTLLGPLDPENLASLLRSSEIYAAPALYEPFGLSVLEAAHAGCALALSDLPSLHENWSGAALFVPPSEDRAWREALDQLISDAALRHKLARAARERASCFSPSKMATAYMSAYCQLAEQSREDWGGEPANASYEEAAAV